MKVALALLLCFSLTANSAKPNIILIVADDLGFNDIGYVNSDIHSPNIDSLAKNGVRFKNSYATAICGPSRSALMTGYDPYHSGTQHKPLNPSQPTGVPLETPILSETLTKFGYRSHAVGKWNLGFCKWAYTPTYRGFESFLGFYSPMEDHLTHEAAQWEWGVSAVDFRDGKEIVLNERNHHSLFLYMDRVEKVIKNHNQTDPLFLYLAFQTPHTPLEIPAQYSNLYKGKGYSKNRQTYMGMISAMDEAVGNMTSWLKAEKMWDNTVIAFTSDNGGEILYSVADNSPLRGGKWYLWEGGTKVRSFIHSNKLKKTDIEVDGMFHITDWYATLLSAANIDYSGIKFIVHNF